MIDIFLKVINNVWPMLFIFTVILVSIRLTYLIYNKQKIVIYKEILTFCFILYILFLYYIVTFQDNNYGTNNFVPFKEIFRYEITSTLFLKNVVGNILLFVPLGLFVTYYVKNKNFIITLILTIFISCTIEFTQYVIGRTADIDDIILNSMGGLLGYVIYSKWNKIIEKLPKFLKNQVFLDIVTIIIIIILVFILCKYEFWRYIS